MLWYCEVQDDDGRWKPARTEDDPRRIYDPKRIRNDAPIAEVDEPLSLDELQAIYGQAEASGASF